MDEEDALATLTAVERLRVSYHNFDVSNLTIQKLEGILWKAYGIGVKDLAHLHWSPMCSTLDHDSSPSSTGRHSPAPADLSVLTAGRGAGLSRIGLYPHYL